MIYKCAFTIILFFSGFIYAQESKYIEVGTFNIEWFPCKDDGEMMKKYDINLRIPPTGDPTNIEALFKLIKELDIELIGVVEIVDPALLESYAQKYLGSEFQVIYAPSAGSQKVGFLYDSSVLEIVGKPQIYADIKLKPDSWLRPAFRVYFKSFQTGFDFHAVVVHLKASPSGWNQREKQWNILKRILGEIEKDSGDKDIILTGDFNNVSKLGFDEFVPRISGLNYLWVTEELVDSLFTNYWQPDYNVERIQGSLIDQIFVSNDAKIEYQQGSLKVGGMCGEGKFEYIGDSIPEFYRQISDHCPVFCTFRADIDHD